MISFKSKKTGSNITLHITGDAVIEHAKEIFVKIKELYDRNTNVIICAREIKAVDISFLQIIISAAEMFSGKNLLLSLDIEDSIAVKRLLHESGYHNLQTSNVLAGNPKIIQVSEPAAEVSDE